MELLVLGGGGAIGRGGLPLDTGHHLGDDNEIDDEGGGKQRVLTNVEKAINNVSKWVAKGRVEKGVLRDGLVATHENLSIVLIQSTLVIGNSRHVLDNNAVVRVLAVLVQDRVGLHHVVNNVRLGNLLGAELLLGAQVLAVVVAEMVVGGNGGQLDTSVDEEVDEGRLHLGLTRLKIITANVGVVLLSKLESTGDESVLGRAVDEGNLVEDASNSKDGGGRNLLVTLLDSLEEIVGSVVDTGDDVGVALSVGGPHDNDLVQAVLLLEVTDVLADMLNVSHGGLTALNEIVGTVFLVGSNEVGVVDGRERDHLGHLLLHLGLEGRLEDLSAVHGLGQVHLADIPTANDEIIGVDHGENIVEGNVDLLGSLGVSAELHGRTHDDGAIVVGLARTFLGLPLEAATVGNDTSSDGGSIVTTPADQHHADARDLAFDLEVVNSLGGSGNESAILSRDGSSTVGVLGFDFSVSVSDIGGVDGEGFGGGHFGESVAVSRPVRGAVGVIRVRSHGSCS